MIVCTLFAIGMSGILHRLRYPVTRVLRGPRMKVLAKSGSVYIAWIEFSFNEPVTRDTRLVRMNSV